jgi:glycosyltransferase involved in cell wall biosynthesis
VSESCGTSLISVLMAVHNGSRWLSEAILSVLNQSRSSFEFVIVNDGSTDESTQICRDYARRDSRIVLLERSHSGLTKSLNAGLTVVRGKWVARLDADDVCDTNRLQIQMDTVSCDDELVLLGASAYEIDLVGKRLREYSYPTHHKQLVHRLRNCGAAFPHSSAVFRTDVVRRIGGYREYFRRSQDLDLWLRLSEVGQIGASEIPLVGIRTHDQQISAEGAGWRQHVYARIAVVSHILRTQHSLDPVALAADSAELQSFEEWIEGRLIQVGEKSYRRALAALKSNVNGQATVSREIALITKSIVEKPGLLKIWAKRRFFGDTLGDRLAYEWLRERHGYENAEGRSAQVTRRRLVDAEIGDRTER